MVDSNKEASPTGGWTRSTHYLPLGKLGIWPTWIPKPVAPSAGAFIGSIVRQVATEFEIDSCLAIVEPGLLTGEGTLQVGDLSLTQCEPENFRPRRTDEIRLLVDVTAFGEPSISARQRMIRTADFMTCISSDGWAVALLPGFYKAFRDSDFSSELRSRGLFLRAVVNPPSRLLGNGLRPVIALVSRTPTDKVFVIDSQDSHDCDISGFFNNQDIGDIRSGTFIDFDDFESFEHWRAHKEIASLEIDFGDFRRLRLEDVAQINRLRSGETFEDLPASVYLPTIGSGPAVNKLSSISMQHHNYLQVVVIEEIASHDYLCAYFNSRHFRLYLEAEKNSRSLVIPKLSVRQAKSLPVTLPSLEKQLEIADNISKLYRLREMVDELAQLVAVNPLVDTQAQQIDDALNVFGRLTQEEEIVALIRDGESKTLEFKETLSLNRHTNQKDKAIETSAVKTIAAFLNSDGGDLLIGIGDHGTVIGLSDELTTFYRESEDNFLLHLRNLIHARIGAEHFVYLNSRIVSVKGKRVLRISCGPSVTEVFVDTTDFYVRTNPATDRLEGRKLIDYCHARFPTSTR